MRVQKDHQGLTHDIKLGGPAEVGLRMGEMSPELEAQVKGWNAVMRDLAEKIRVLREQYEREQEAEGPRIPIRIKRG